VLRLWTWKRQLNQCELQACWQNTILFEQPLIDPPRILLVGQIYLFTAGTTLSRSVENAYHALAIHEKRCDFEPTLWRKQEPEGSDQTLEQVWFCGVHSDVGGGYVEEQLSDVALLWMIEKAKSRGLGFREDF